MKRILLLASFFIIILSNYVCASSWENVYYDNEESAYIDIDSIRYAYDKENGFDVNHILFWEKIHLDKHKNDDFKDLDTMYCYNNLNVNDRKCAILAYDYIDTKGNRYDMRNGSGKFLSIDRNGETLAVYNFLVQYCKNNDELIKENEGKGISISD